jgi:hypothetical protein
MAGDTIMLTLLPTVTIAEATNCAGGPVVAWTVTGFVEGKSTGEVYAAVFMPDPDPDSDPPGAIVPRAELPPTAPFTSHVMRVPSGTQKDAVKICVCPRGTVVTGGEMTPMAAHLIVTLALADLELSAELVALIVSVEGDGATDGAV